MLTLLCPEGTDCTLRCRIAALLSARDAESLRTWCCFDWCEASQPECWRRTKVDNACIFLFRVLVPVSNSTAARARAPMLVVAPTTNGSTQPLDGAGALTVCRGSRPVGGGHKSNSRGLCCRLVAARLLRCGEALNERAVESREDRQSVISRAYGPCGIITADAKKNRPPPRTPRLTWCWVVCRVVSCAEVDGAS